MMWRALFISPGLHFRRSRRDADVLRRRHIPVGLPAPRSAVSPYYTAVGPAILGVSDVLGPGTYTRPLVSSTYALLWYMLGDFRYKSGSG